MAGGAVPLAGGLLSAIAGAWSEAEQDRQNQFFLPSLRSGCVQRCSEKSISFRVLFWALEWNEKIFSPHKQALRDGIRWPAVPPIKTITCIITHPLKPSVRKSVRKQLRVLVLNPAGYDIAVHARYAEVFRLRTPAAMPARARSSPSPRRPSTGHRAPKPTESSRNAARRAKMSGSGRVRAL